MLTTKDLNPASAPKKITRIGFLLLDNFTMMALASAIEPLRMANQLSGEELYSWHIVSEKGDSISASDGLSFNSDFSITDVCELDMVLVVGGVNITRSYTTAQVQWLQSLARRGVALGGICTGAYVLAHAGLLDGYDCSIHWECMAALQERYPKVHCNNRLFTIDNKRLTSSGGNAPLDMMLSLITRDHGSNLSRAVSDMFICDRIRSDQDQQRIPLRQVHKSGESKPKLVDVIELMENNLEEPISLDELACFVDVSRRQLERMFLKYVDCSPSRYYLRLRLDRARQLLKQSNMSIVEIAAACGFISTPHFSRCYRKHIGVSPRDERKNEFGVAQTPVIQDSLIDDALPKTTDRARAALVCAQVEPSFGSVALVIPAAC
ncbi:GlxA family transcriptional regulator [Oceanospirillum sediminis]|uniref:GlxA family transcriptional regulator n=1 Tax=Oceanospirillum sediminis TaxID=2760088 RepID=A0A839INH5_9GAMM|nr:GlxA family transcriptional regulator [Oceanospirillum sediminis]MBB1486785.1 GlxA family transcriptional regulator [Oceanospirillum sediminis]